MKMLHGKNKFRFEEIFLNSDGKTSGSGFVGIILGLVGCLAFIASIIGFFLQLEDVIPFMQQTIFFIGAATVLLGVRKWKGDKETTPTVPPINSEIG